MTTTHDAPASTTTPAGYELREVDPASLVDNPNNARRAHRDREGLAASIGTLGILHPPLVRQSADGRLEIIAGERRKYSAIKAGSTTIPVFVRDDLSDLHQVAGMLVENHDRDGLTPTEEAVAIQQLAGFDGVTQRDITAMTGIKAGEVRTALKVAGSLVATAIGERHDLSMEHLVVLAEFDADTEVVKRLVERAVKDPARFDHLVAELRRDRDDRAAFQVLADQITESGVALVELENGWWLPNGSDWLCDLPAPEGAKSLTAAKHRTCPGHAGAVREAGEGYELGYLCLDSVGHGHVAERKGAHGTSPSTSPQAAPGMSDDQKAERRLVITNNKAWDVATPVRQAYVSELLARRTVPKGTLRYVTEAIMADPRGLVEGDGNHVAAILGKESNPGTWDRTVAVALTTDAADARLPLVLLAQVAASVEARFGDRQGWRHPNAALVSYLSFLAVCGYGLSEVEQEVIETREQAG